jgi:hypothetical protein
MKTPALAVLAYILSPLTAKPSARRGQARVKTTVARYKSRDDATEQTASHGMK